MPVETSWSGSTAILTLSNPPVNTGDAALRRDLRDALLSAAAVADLSGVVIESSGRHFYAGSDIGELDGPIEEPQLTAVIAVIIAAAAIMLGKAHAYPSARAERPAGSVGASCWMRCRFGSVRRRSRTGPCRVTGRGTCWRARGSHTSSPSSSARRGT